MAAQDQLEIIDGDPKDKLTPQLNDIGRIDPRSRPHFTIVIARGQIGRTSLPVLINSIGAEDGSGDNWLIGGYINADIVRQLPWLEAYRHFQGYYNTRTRKGWVKSCA